MNTINRAVHGITNIVHVINIRVFNETQDNPVHNVARGRTQRKISSNGDSCFTVVVSLVQISARELASLLMFLVVFPQSLEENAGIMITIRTTRLPYTA
jgi:hypothetical protein